LGDNVPEDVVYVTYLFLHEVGHWVKFTQINKNVYDFFEEDLQLSQENHLKMQEFLLQRQKRLDKESSFQLTSLQEFLLQRQQELVNTTTLTFREKKIVETIQKEYRNIPKEKDADIFAINNLEYALTTYKSKKLKS
jgi:hypothetical protein